MFKKSEEILSLEKIESIKDSVRQIMKDRYGDSIARAEIAIGDFYNGIALIYIGYSQQQMNEMLETNAFAQLAIDTNGDFIKFKLEKGHEYYGFETYISESDSTLVRFNLQRAKDIIGNNTITTDEFSSWQFSKDKYKLANEIFCYCKVEKGKKSPYTEPIYEYLVNEKEEYEDYSDDYQYYGDFDYEDYGDFDYEDDNDEFYDDEYTPILSATFYIRCWGSNRTILQPIKLDTNQNTLYVIKGRYILLCDNMRNYMPDEYFEYENPDKYVYSYYNLFARYHIDSTDILENRYGVFDLSVKKTIIHVGEMDYIQAMISGFVRLDFTPYQSIITFDYFDRKANKGIPYNKKLTYNGVSNLATSCIDGREYNRAANIITDYWNNEKSRTGKNTGEWYIIREGKHAGRSLCWLLANNYIKDIVNMIVSSYISFNNFQKFTYPSSYDKKNRDKIWLALDSNKIFEEVKNTTDVLELTEPFNSYDLTKHQSLTIDLWGEDEPNFEQLVEIDTDYLVGLIEHHCLLVDVDVIDELEESYEGNKSYLNKLSKVKEANEGFRAEITQYKERCEDEMRSHWEEEEQRYWENEGYRSAFEDDSDAEWNID